MLYPGVSLEGMLQGYRDQYLQKRGWVCSVEKRSSVDERGEAIPWLTYPACTFLAQIVRPEFKVFEFGSGSSTIWWGARVAEVHSVDHDAAWVGRTRPQCSANVNLRLIPADTPCAETGADLLTRYFTEVSEPPSALDRETLFRRGLLSEPFRAYAADILRFSSGYFDVIVIDGMARALTTWLTVQHARPKQFIVFDNSDREEYAPAYAMLKDAGYHRIDFWGTGPINPYEWCTTIFLRDLRVLP